MNDKTKKIVKICCWVVGIIILIPILLVATLPLWLGPVFRPTVNAVAPKITKTVFHIDSLYLNPYTCNFELGGVTIGNPPGFAETNAVSLGYLNVDVDTSTLTKNVIVIENIEINDMYITMLKGKDGKSNLEMIEDNVYGAEARAEKEIIAQQKKEAEAMRREGMSEAEIKAEEEKALINRKLIVNRLAFKNVSGKISVSGLFNVPFRVPSIELKDIGRDSGGYDLDHLYTAIVKEFWASVMASAGNVGGALGSGASKTMDALKGVGGSIKNMFKSSK